MSDHHLLMAEKLGLSAPRGLLAVNQVISTQGTSRGFRNTTGLDQIPLETTSDPVPT